MAEQLTRLPGPNFQLESLSFKFGRYVLLGAVEGRLSLWCRGRPTERQPSNPIQPSSHYIYPMHEIDIGIVQEWVEVALTYIFFFAQPNTSTRVCDLVARASMPRW